MLAHQGGDSTDYMQTLHKILQRFLTSPEGLHTHYTLVPKPCMVASSIMASANQASEAKYR